MKACPTCDLVYNYESLQFCRFDGTRLVNTYGGEETTKMLPSPQMPKPKARAHVDRTGELKSHNQFR
jgi:hypothetical protein